ncbi:uncharacterized protein C2845_PM03G01350 [Panicum miliaceum]|uniref:Uncharacterized protein n=1 Tax=Panicum miliaceum TaxID=4540 RepID=A0A3L6TBU4_PANMI|nr:uncharacterized protein C2845_PM03G01350 [Panicum miliaceum]
MLLARDPRIGPRSEYLCLPAGADRGPMLRRDLGGRGGGEGGGREELQQFLEADKEEEEDSATTDGRPLWSILVGCTSADHPSHDLRIHYFQVTASGRVIGHNNDLLELFCGVSRIDDKHTMFPVARAAIVPADHHLYIICAHWPATGSSSTSGHQADERVFHPKAFSLNTADKSLSTLPPLPFSGGSWEAITACGKLWVPLVSELIGDCWAEVSSVEFPYKRLLEHGYNGTLLQGYVVLDSRFILLSFSNSSFFLFKCTSGQLSQVDTDGTDQYVPIRGKAVHVRRDGMIYFIPGTKLFAYKNPPNWDKPLAAPIVIGNIWPYDEEGYGFMEHLSGRMVCAVWINMRQPCGCATRHALITTLSIRGAIDESGCFVPNGVDILHSTCRRIDMLRSNAPGYTCCDIFCFLQEFLSGKPEPGRGGKLSCTDKALEAVLHLDTVRFGDVGIHDPPAWVCFIQQELRNFVEGPDREASQRPSCVPRPATAVRPDLNKRRRNALEMLPPAIILAAVPCDEDGTGAIGAHGGWRIHPGKPREAEDFERRIGTVGALLKRSQRVSSPGRHGSITSRSRAGPERQGQAV